LRWSTAAEAPLQLGVGSTEEVLATFSGEAAGRHPPAGPTTDEAGVEHPGKEGVRLLTWGDPYLTAWQGAVRGEPLSEATPRDASWALASGAGDTGPASVPDRLPVVRQLLPSG
jgi:hypothetical protein